MQDCGTSRTGEIVGSSDFAMRAVELCFDAVHGNGEVAQRWEDAFTELDSILERADTEMVHRILNDDRYRAIRKSVHYVRAEYEYERELALAREIVSAGSAAPAAAFRSANWYDQATLFEMRALSRFRPKSLLFVGAGPFPTSPLSYMQADPSISVTCLERQQEARDIAVEVAGIFGFSDFDVVSSGLLEFTEFADFDCVIIGLVVGITETEKAEIAAHLKRWVPPETLLAVRTAVGSGRVIYPEFELSPFDNDEPRVLADPPHKSFTLAIVNPGRQAP